jgi:hypothetical protein
MNKIHASSALNTEMAPRDIPAAPARAPMSAPELTPLVPPGASRAALATTASRPQEASHWRQAIFDRAFDDLQQRLADNRLAGQASGAAATGGLAGAERRDCDAALQWISACVMATGAR